nr:hypothetical protein [Tanacetum cinerariifolium]
MAEVSYLQLHENHELDNENDVDQFDDTNHVIVQNHLHDNWSTDIEGFGHVYPWDDDYPSSHDFSSNDNNSVANFVMDMFHQRVEQSQSHASARVSNLHEYNVHEDLAWEEVDGPIDDHEIHDEALESNHEQTDALEWEVLADNHNLELNPELSDYNYIEYEMPFGQFADNDSSSMGRPPASKTVVENLLSVVMTDEDIENNYTICAVCKDEIGVGLIAKQLPCAHRYHGDCILPWLGIKNTCPVCRYELLTDDLDYERKKAETAAHV